MATATQDEVTRYLVRLRAGDGTAAGELLPLVYDELRALARRYVAQEREGFAFDATSLVHEVYLRLVSEPETNWEGRAHFFAVAAKALRQLLIDYARARRTEKRGAGRERVELRSGDAVVACDADEWLDLDEALQKLAVLDARQAQIVELRFFGGLSFEEVGEVLGVCSKTISREWKAARAWLGATLDRSNGSNGEQASAG
jgi:RNA polymerase sigma factor (TIGR02999 family)